MKHLEAFFEYNKPTRGNEINREEFLSILNTNCKDWLSSPHALVRRKESESYKFSLIDPTKSIRRSINKTNHVVMLMDNLPSWSNFPKRSNSVIFSVNIKNEKRYAPAFGSDIYFVIPFDNANFGVAPEIDLWSAKIKTGKDENHWFFKELALNDDLSDLFAYFNFSTDYRTFSSEVNDFFNSEINDKYGKHILYFKEKFVESGERTFMDYLNKFLKPSNFYDGKDMSVDGYKVMNYTEMINNPTRRGNECWTDSKCLVYYAGHSDLTIENVDKLYENFLKEIGI